MSMYADYLKERTEDRIIESPIGFATYRFLNEKQVYIVDIYIKPEHRERGHAGALADLVASQARISGRTELIGTVVPSMKNSATNMQILLSYGMKPFMIDGNAVVFRKEI